MEDLKILESSARSDKWRPTLAKFNFNERKKDRRSRCESY